MSSRVNLNEIPYFPWKGKTFVQVSSTLQQNGVTGDPGSNIFRATPVKLYRREIAVLGKPGCNERISQSIDGYDMPNGSLIYAQSPAHLCGIQGTKDIHLTANTTERPGLCTNTNICNETNARRRVRSSGMIKRHYNSHKNNDTYCTSSTQYLVSRNRTFQQNQYNFIRIGDPSVKPGNTLSVSNIYSANGINHCSSYFIASDVSFQYNWLDDVSYTVDVSSGYYDIETMNDVLKQTMLQNSHYFINKFNNTNLYLLNMAYNSSSNAIELQTFIANNVLYNSANYKVSTNMTSAAWANSTATLTSSFILPANPLFESAIGFRAGTYPASKDGITTNQAFLSNYTPGIQPQYVPIYYKPNNPQFAQQGGVTASSLIVRKKYNAITNSTAVYYKAYGKSVGNALAYGVSESGYTIKDKIGYPLTKTPVFSKTTGELINCASGDCRVKHP